jgi:hypothetical protein
MFLYVRIVVLLLVHLLTRVYLVDPSALLPEFDEFICRGCMASHPFLYHYVDMASSLPPYDGTNHECVLKKTTATTPSEATAAVRHHVPTFWNEGWRSTLCKCSDCMTLYRSLKCTFLLDEDDSLSAYERRAQAKQDDIVTAGEKAFQSELSHVQQVMCGH